MTDHFYKVEESCQIAGLEYIYQGVFGRKANGTFVEVGAYDGRTYSNTWCLAELGWRGLYIEPIKEFFDRCVGNHKNHPNVRCINKMVGWGFPVVVKKLGELYTGSIALQHLHNIDEVVGTFDTVKLDELLNEHWTKKLLDNATYYIPIDVLVIDAEGMDWEIIGEFDLSLWHPALIIVETHKFRNIEIYNINADSINVKMQSCGYKEIYADNINSIYVKT